MGCDKRPQERMKASSWPAAESGEAENKEGTAKGVDSSVMRGCSVEKTDGYWSGRASACHKG